MKYSEFIETVAEVCSKENLGEHNYTPWGGKFPKECLCVYWTSGGSSGASCWGTESYSITPDPPEELKSLDFVLGEVCPDITFLEYRQLRSKLLKRDTCSDTSDYYGNYTVYAYELVDLKELYDYLLEKEFINND